MSPDRKQRILDRFEREVSHDGIVYLETYNDRRADKLIESWFMTTPELPLSEVLARFTAEFVDAATPLVHADMLEFLQMARTRKQIARTGDVLNHEEVHEVLKEYKSSLGDEFPLGFELPILTQAPNAEN